MSPTFGDHEADTHAYPQTGEDDDEQTHVASLEDMHLGGLAGAFQAAVSAPAASALEALNMAADDWYVGINGVPVGPMRLGEVRSKAAAGALDGNSLVWRDGFEDWKPLKTYPELLAIIEDVVPRPSQVRASLAPVASVGQVSDPFASGAGAIDQEEIPGLKRTGMPWAVWVTILAAMGLGFALSFAIFGGQQEPRVRTVMVERPVAPKPEEDKTPTDPSPADEASPEEAGDTASTPKSQNGSGATRKANSESPEKSTEGGGLRGLAGLRGLPGNGPQGPSGTAPERSGGGQPLDSAQVQRTVSRYTKSVQRSCWQPALDTRDANAPTSARVAVTIKVAPSGSVAGVSTSGDPKGYRGLSSCIAARVRGWQFPASSGTTTVNVPFVFAAQ